MLHLSHQRNTLRRVRKSAKESRELVTVATDGVCDVMAIFLARVARMSKSVSSPDSHENVASLSGDARLSSTARAQEMRTIQAWSRLAFLPILGVPSMVILIGLRA